MIMPTHLSIVLQCALFIACEIRIYLKTFFIEFIRSGLVPKYFFNTTVYGGEIE